MTGLAEIDGRLYCFEEDGRMFIGEREVEGQIFSFTPEGLLIQGQKLPACHRYTKGGQRMEEEAETGNEKYYLRYLPMLLLFLYGAVLVERIRKRPGEKEEKTLRFVISAANVLSVSGLVGIYGLFDDMFFNKTICSVAVFLVSMILTEKMMEDVRNDKRAALASFFLSVLLAFTEVLGMGLRIFVNDEQVLRPATGILWMALSALPLSCLAEPFFFWLFWLVKEGPEGESPKDGNRVFWKSWLAVFAGYIPCFLAFFPGLYCYDMIWQCMLCSSFWCFPGVLPLGCDFCIKSRFPGNGGQLQWDIIFCSLFSRFQESAPQRMCCLPACFW